jgi:hypothetical protein
MAVSWLWLYVPYISNHTAKTKYRNFETNVPRIGISGPQSQFPHLCAVSDLYIPMIGLHAYSAGGSMKTAPGSV